MSNTPAIPQATLRAEIRSVLRDNHGLPAGYRRSATAKQLAVSLGAPVRLIREELEQMAREGLTTTRTTRAGDVLYKLTDRNDQLWAAFQGPGARPHRATV